MCLLAGSHCSPRSSSQVNGQALSKAFAPQTKPWIALARALGTVLCTVGKEVQGSVQVCTLGELGRLHPVFGCRYPNGWAAQQGMWGHTGLDGWNGRVTSEGMGGRVGIWGCEWVDGWVEGPAPG